MLLLLPIDNMNITRSARLGLKAQTYGCEREGKLSISRKTYGGVDENTPLSIPNTPPADNESSKFLRVKKLRTEKYPIS